MYSIFSYRLRALRQAAGLSQKQLAVTLHVTAATLSNYENGIYLPPLDKAMVLAKELDCSLDYLCGLTDENLHIGQLNGFLHSHANAISKKQSKNSKSEQITKDYLHTPDIHLVAEENRT